jgi:ParB/RepB/Spo0J family partition protein
MDNPGNPHRCGDYADLPIDSLVADSQPRTHFDAAEMAELAASIQDRGQLQAIRVTWDPVRGKWRVLVGERRLRACRLAGQTRVRCQIVERALTAGELIVEQLAENRHRQGLRPMEEARAFRDLMRTEGWSARQLAAHLHVAPSTVTRTLKLLELLPEEQEGVASRNTSPKAARGERRKSKVLRGATLTFRTPKRNVLTLATARKSLTELEAADEMEATAAKIRARWKGGEAGPRLATDTAPPDAGEVA